ncbi:hypothetical protein FQN49_008029 [Arthroderma sp. PD_2]|nr:hypothetical protein FQN49_008029 [Arthroderma sp. PD_2]
MAPGDSKRDKSLMEKWLASDEVYTYVKPDDKRGVMELPSQKETCKMKFAKLFYGLEPMREPYPHEPRPVEQDLEGNTRAPPPLCARKHLKIIIRWFFLRVWQDTVGENRCSALLLAAAAIARLIAIFTKKAFSDLLKKGSYLIWLYLLGEALVLAALIAQQRMAADPRKSLLRSGAFVSICAIWSPVMDSVASIFLGNIEGASDSNTTSIVAKLVCDIFVAAVTFIPLCQKMRKCGFYPVLRPKPEKHDMWEQIPTDYKVWALDSLGDHLDKGGREPLPPARLNVDLRSRSRYATPLEIELSRSTSANRRSVQPRAALRARANED